jgi:TonB-linked SusC/RagA family outer membrane protein
MTNVSGSIHDNNGDPIVGVSIGIKGTTKGTIADVNGNFQIPMQQTEEVLVFKMIGYQTEEVTVKDKSKPLNVVLFESSEQLEDVVVIGYGSVKKKDLTGSVSHIGKEVTETKVATNFIDFLKGSVAGLRVSVDNSASGGGTMQIRGPASLRAQPTPLVVLDGNIFYGTLSDINPNDVESIDVLKDASSAAIFGSKASAGAIMITTKKGQSEKPVINVSAKLGTTQVRTMPDLPTPEQYVRRRMDYFKTNNYFIPEDNKSKMPLGYYDDPYNLPSGVTQDQWAAYEEFSGDYIETWLTRLQFNYDEILNYKAGKTTDWRDLVYRTGLRQDYNVSVSGKSNRTNYYISLGRTDNEGFKVGNEFQATRVRANFDAEIQKWFTFGLNAQFADRTNNSITANTDQADVLSPYLQAYNEDGTLNIYPYNDQRSLNPLAASLNNDQFHKTQTLNATIYGLLKLPYGITFRTNVTNRFGWRKQYYYTSRAASSIDKTSRDEYSDYEWLIDNILKWDYTFNDIHKVDLTFVAGSEKHSYWTTTATNEDFSPSGSMGYHNLDGGKKFNASASDGVQTGTTLLGRLNYGLMDKYLFTASVRRDGFSAFGVNNPHGVYPAFAVAWRLSEEKFVKSKALDNLKVRFSWGENGNRDIGRYVALSRLNITDHIQNGESVSGLWTDNMANQSLKWERTRALNLGLDFGFFNGRLSGVVDLYSSKTTDLILDRTLPNITGFKTVISNLGQVNNKGIELTLSSVNLNIPKKVHWSTTFIYSANDNEIKHLYGDMIDVLDNDGNVIGQRESDDLDNGWYIGHGIHTVWDYKMIGIWQLGEEDEAAKYGKQPGDPKLLDVNEDGVLDNNDRLFMGSKIPRYSMSLRNDFTFFDCINLAFVLRGEFNYLGEDSMPRNQDSRYYDRFNSVWTEYWTPDNPSNEYARLGSNSSNPTARIYKKRDYIRLQNASLGYIFPKKFLKKFSVENLKVSLNVDNAFVITNWKYYDPENIGTSPRIFTFGVNITL